MSINLNRLKKDEILYLYNHKCRHGHRYIEHTNCYLTEKPNHSQIFEKIGAFDIETSNLQATFGIVFSYCIKLEDGTIIGRSITPTEMKKKIFDKDLLKEMVENLSKLDVCITWFGEYFDIPFVRSRCLHHNIPFIEWKGLKHIDLWKTCKRKLKIHSNRLQACCNFLNIPAKGHPIKSDVWFGAMAGDKKALDYIYTHNVEDVDSTIAVYHKFKPYMTNTKPSV